MKNTYQQFVFASFLVLVTQGIKAQFDDVYYDPSKVRKEDNYYKETIKPNEKEVRLEDDLKSKQAEETYRDSGDYDDEYSEWDDQDYYYASRIKRFHRPYRGFSYYDPCYVDYYFYDPFSYDPWYWDQDIYSASWYYSPYYSYTRYHYRPWRYNYWNYWDGYYGWGCNPYTYSYWPGTCYSGYYNYYGGGYSNHGHYNNNHGHGYNDNPKGTYRGSRGFGLTNTSKRGPVRVYNPSPKVFTSKPGDHAKPTIEKRVIRSADGDTYSPRPDFKPERNSGRKELPGNSTENPKPDRGSGRDGYKPKETPGERNAPDRDNNAPKREYRPERSEPKPNQQYEPPKRKEREEGDRFKPHRDYQSEPSSSPRPESKPRERSEFSQPRMERTESRPSSNSNSNSGSNSNKESSSGGNRRTPR